MNNEKQARQPRLVLASLFWVAESQGLQLSEHRARAILDQLTAAGIQDCDAADAIRSVGRESEYFPRPSQIIERARQLARDRVLGVPLLDLPDPTEQEREFLLQQMKEFREQKGWG